MSTDQPCEEQEEPPRPSVRDDGRGWFPWLALAGTDDDDRARRARVRGPRSERGR